ncbi:glucose 1-dehydrogenase [Streptomyces sp. NPDC048278]|uniref:SDR family NAD(P)-dependent oxidoreductase n=1 Tax=Streptomyces sp. NPDC048278 TaxID=3155809 RepID=UPI00342E6323
MSLRGKTAIVTGGGSGIGRATALRLARHGVALVLAGRRADALAAVAEEVREGGGTAIEVTADLTREAEAARVAEEAVREFGAVHLAVNSAGGGRGLKPVDGYAEAAFDEIMQLNVKTAWLSMKYQIPRMRDAGGGAIVNVSSLQGLRGVRNASAYSAAKHAVVGLTKSAALEVSGDGIRVNVVCPGPVRTSQFEEILAERMPGVPADEAEKRFAALFPLGRIAEPDEVAATIVWLLGADSGYVTGSVIPVDGGATAG